MSNLTEHIIASATSSDTIQKLEFFQGIWEFVDSSGKHIQAQVNYLLALLYEQEGDYRKAVDFFEIWENQPETIWANLASSRLDQGH